MGPSAEILRERCEGEAAADCSVSALPLLETFLASIAIHLFLPQLHFVDYSWEHYFDKNPVAFASSVVFAPQDPKSQNPVIYSLSATVVCSCCAIPER